MNAVFGMLEHLPKASQVKGAEDSSQVSSTLLYVFHCKLVNARLLVEFKEIFNDVVTMPFFLGYTEIRSVVQ